MVNVIAEPLNVYSTPGATSKPLRNKRRLEAGLGAEAKVKPTFVPLITPAGNSPSVKLVVEPVPAIR